MDCWSVLGIEAASDEREVKRAYARLLKTHRPDADPEGFRRIRDAYQQALALSGAGSATWTPAPALGDDAPPSMPSRPDGTGAAIDDDAIDAAAAAVLAGITDPVQLDDRASLDRWSGAISRLMARRPAEVASQVDPALAARAAARGRIDAVAGLWSHWASVRDWDRQIAYARAWLVECAASPEQEASTVELAQAMAIVEPTLAASLCDKAFAADPAMSSRRISASNYDVLAMIGRECASEEPRVRRALAQLFEGDPIPAGSPEADAVLRSLADMPTAGKVMQWLRQANPRASARLQVEREMRALSPEARGRLAQALSTETWQAIGDQVHREIVLGLAHATLPSALLAEVHRVLPELAVEADVERVRRISSEPRERESLGIGLALLKHPMIWLFGLMILGASGRAFNRVEQEAGNERYWQKIQELERVRHPPADPGRLPFELPKGALHPTPNHAPGWDPSAMGDPWNSIKPHPVPKAEVIPFAGSRFDHRSPASTPGTPSGPPPPAEAVPPPAAPPDPRPSEPARATAAPLDATTAPPAAEAAPGAP